MAKLQWNQKLIADLAALVRAHNQAHPRECHTKLTDLKKAYAGSHHGSDADRAAMAAMKGVQRHLEKLAKSFDDTKHPRGAKGEFASGGGRKTLADLPLAQSESQHRQLQAADPTYNALTTAVIPETRNALEGALIREVGSAALGAGLVLGLSRSGGSKMIQAAGRRAGAAAFGVPVSVMTHGAAKAGQFVGGKTVRYVARKTSPMVGPNTARVVARNIARNFGRKSRGLHPAADYATDKAQQFGGFVGGGLGWGAAQLGHLGVNGATGLAGKYVHPKVARAGVLTGLSLGTGAIINSQIAGTGFDPQVYGAGLDAYSYRTIQKIAGGDALLDAVAEEYLAKLDGLTVDGALTKAGFYNRSALIGLPSAAAAAGAAVAGGAAEVGHLIAGSRRTDPYRDSKGRFATRSNAVTVGSAVAGALAAGAGVYLALRRHNVGNLVRHVDTIADTIGRQMEAIHSPDGVGHVAELIKSRGKLPETEANRATDIHNLMRDDPEYRAGLDALESYGGGSESYLKSKIKDEVHKKLADQLANVNEFRVPGVGKPDTWKTIGQIRAEAGPYKADRAASNAALASLDSATRENFEKGLAGVSDQQRETALFWLNKRDSSINNVSSDIAAHQAKIDAALAGVDKAKEAQAATLKALDDAKAVYDRADTDEAKAAAEKGVEAATKAHATAVRATDKAEKAHAELRDQPSGVMSPVTNKPIPPATDLDLEPHRQRLRSEAAFRATKTVDAKIAKAQKAHDDAIAKGRAQQAQDLTARGDRMLAARAALGHSLGALPDKAAFAGIRTTAIRRSIKKAKAQVIAAEASLAAAEKRAAALKIASKGKTPKGMSPEDTKALLDDAQNVGHAVTQAKQALDTANGRVSAREFLLNKHAAQFLTDIRAEPIVERSIGKTPVTTYRRLLRDVARASKDVRKPVNAFLHSPSAKALKNFAVSVGKSAKGHATGIGENLRDVYRAALAHKTGELDANGKPVYTFSARKAIIGGGVLGALTGDLTHDLYSYGKARVFAKPASDDDGKRPPAFPTKSITKIPGRLHIEKHVDPVTGQGFIGVSVNDPDPANKGERVLIWGESFKNADAPGEQLHPGSRVSTVRTKLANNQQGGQGGGQGGQQQSFDIANLPDDVKQSVGKALGDIKDQMHTVQVEDGHQVRYRAGKENTKDAEADKVEKHIRTSFLSGGQSPTGQRYYDALNAITGSKQGRILKQNAAYKLITGYGAGGGNKLGTGVFHTGDDSDFASQKPEEVLDALTGEVDRAVKAHPPGNDAQKIALVRAVATVGQRKGVKQEDLKALYDKIRGASPSPGNSASSAASGASSSAPGPKITPAHPLGSTMNANTSTTAHNWDQAELREASLPMAQRLGADLGFRSQERIADLATAMEHLAGAVHTTHDLPMRSALFAASDAIRNVAKGDAGNKVLALDAIRSADHEHFFSELQAEGDKQVERLRQREKVSKTWFIDDLDALMKGFISDVSDEARNAFGEWTRGGGAAAGAGGAASNSVSEPSLPREFAEESIDRAGRDKESPPPGRKVSNYTPTKVGADVGGSLLGEAAGVGVSTILDRLFPEAEGGVKLISALRSAYAEGGLGAAARSVRTVIPQVAGQTIRNAPKAAGKTIASGAAGLAGYTAGRAAGAGAVRAAYGTVGAKAPEPSESTGGIAEALGNIGGSIAGATAGKAAGRVLGGVVGVLGGPGGEIAGQILGGAAGSYLGGALGRNVPDIASSVSKWFDGYDKDKAASLMRKHTQPAVPVA